MTNGPSPPKAHKFARFLVACCSGKEWKEDVLNTFDERYEEMTKEFGLVYAKWWSWQQAIRSIPYRSLWFIGPLTGAAGTIIWRLVS